MVPRQSELDRQIEEGAEGRGSGVGGQDGDQGDREGGTRASIRRNLFYTLDHPITGGQFTKTFWRQSALWVIPQEEYVVYLKISLAETVG